MTHPNHGLRLSFPRAGNITQHFGETHFQGSQPPCCTPTAIPLARRKEKACLGLISSVIAYRLGREVGAGKGSCSRVSTPGTLHSMQGHSEQQRGRGSIMRTQGTHFHHGSQKDCGVLSKHGGGWWPRKWQVGRAVMGGGWGVGAAECSPSQRHSWSQALVTEGDVGKRQLKRQKKVKYQT